ncbi:MAG: IS30 family transposase [Deltaproteobacteria bacterium]|nr:IS30 family transposase [Deltaproteobacteria bacterium]
MHKQQYKQLGQKERDTIFQLKKKGMANSDIAKKLGRDKSTIGRELTRNQHRKLQQYLPDTAQRKADKRKTFGRKARYVIKRPALKKKIIRLLKIGWSPDLIAGRMNRKKELCLNQESIYQFIYSLEGRKQNLRQYLRRAHRIRHKKAGRKHWKESRIPNRVGIAKRPKTVEKRKQFGHWEGDNVVYNRHRRVLSTAVERKTRKVMIFRPHDLTAKAKALATIHRYRNLPQAAKRTMTYDNGLEAAAHETVTAAIGMKFYFANTYSSWQRGTNENRNGLVRFYLPRETNLDRVTHGQIRRVENLINNRPMKCLDFQTPNEAFTIEMNRLAKRSLSTNSKNFYPQVALVN